MGMGMGMVCTAIRGSQSTIFLPPSGYWDWNWGPQSWPQVPLSMEPFHRPYYGPDEETQMWIIFLLSISKINVKCQHLWCPRENYLPAVEVFSCIFQKPANTTFYFPFSLPNAVWHIFYLKSKTHSRNCIIPLGMNICNKYTTTLVAKRIKNVLAV